MIRLQGITKRFGKVQALGPVDLEIRTGESLGIFGHNGSGKTTLLRILVGLSKPTSGSLLIDGKPPGGREWREFRRQLGFMPERIAFHENLTGTQTLAHFARLRGTAKEKVAPMLERVGLGDAAKRKVVGYSKGMLQRLNLAQALLGDPRILIVDEPIEGLDPQGVRLFFELLAEGDERTVVLSSHRLLKLSNAVERICLLSDGEIRALGTTAELSRTHELPVKVFVYPRAQSNGTLEGALREIEAVSVVKENGRLVASVPQDRKIAFLAELKALSGAIGDLRIEEPTLEEVYFETE